MAAAKHKTLNIEVLACDQRSLGTSTNIYESARISASYPRPLRRPSARAINSQRAVFSACSARTALLPTSSAQLTPRSVPQTLEALVACRHSNHEGLPHIPLVPSKKDRGS